MRKFNNDEYGITDCTSTSRILLRLNYIDDEGNVRATVPSWTYHCEESRATALRAAKRERKKLLQQPQFKEYLDRVYLPASSEYAVPRRRADGTSQAGVIKALPGLWIAITKSHPKVVGKQVNYVNVMAGIAEGNKRKLKGWSVRKYGLATALREAAFWRSTALGTEIPSEQELELGHQQVMQKYAAYIDEK